VTLLVSYSGVLGGAERILLDWGAAVPDPLLACPNGPLAAAARAAGFEVVVLPERSLRFRGAPVSAARALGALARDVSTLVERRRPPAIVASGRRPVLACALARRRGVPVVAIHNDLPTGPALERAVRWATARCDAVVALSATVARTVGPRARVIHPGVDLAHWRPTPLPAEPRALVLGALVPWKRADLALEVAARVSELRLEIAGATLPGDPPDFERGLRARAGRPDLAGRVTFAGALADPRPALARARLLLHCADREPYGLVLVEALASGRPVVAPGAGGPAEILAGGGGRLYRPGDPDDAAAAIRAVLASPGDPRARAEAFDGAAAARRFGAVVEAVRVAAPRPAWRP